MKNLTKISVGVDVSKDTLAVHILPIAESHIFENNAKGMRKFIKILKLYSVNQIVCEATGGYEKRMLEALKKHDFKTWLVEPKRIKAFGYSRGIKAKTDAIDARIIALFASEMTLEHEKTYERDPELHMFVSRKRDLTNMLKQEKVRLKHPQDNCKKNIKLHIKFLEEQIRLLDKEISEVVLSKDDLKRKVEIMTSMPGIAIKSATIILAEMPELGDIENKKISSLAGVAPHTHESGKFKGKASISGGREYPRNTLFMVALVASKHNTVFRDFYKRLINAGKPKKVALVALMRKIITTLNAMLRNGTTWNENIAFA